MVALVGLKFGRVAMQRSAQSMKERVQDLNSIELHLDKLEAQLAEGFRLDVGDLESYAGLARRTESAITRVALVLPEVIYVRKAIDQLRPEVVTYRDAN
jgi:hypothetical protein